MDENEKQAYLEEYHLEKEKGVPFFPDIIFKDTVVVFLVFLTLVALAAFMGAPLEERANPADTTYTPRPEWYFLFLFQLLKYFPGNLEVIGVVAIPTLGILLLFLLPFLDRSPRRHFSGRPWVIGITAVGIIGVGYLSIQSIRETPPPVEVSGGDETAGLYTKNCSGCHGANIAVAPGTNLHDVISSGKHEGMPAWSGDLTSDQIDALAGFILSPGGSVLFTENCSACHEVGQLVSSDPIELKNALQNGKEYAPHQDLEIPDWSTVLPPEGQTQLLNFLVAPDGRRLFETNCSICHGRSIGYQGDRESLSLIISQGGLHLDMPPWRATLSDADLQTLAAFVVNPSSSQDGQGLFAAHCASCHGDRIPRVSTEEDAYQKIASGGAHETMPIWGNVLTPDQLDALVTYTLQASEGSSVELGQDLFDRNCALCHGTFGEGGPNPAQKGDIIAPISSAEYLKTRDDFTLRAVIAQGQPNLGMASFGASSGGPLDDDEIDAIVSYLRSWEANPPVELPPEVAQETLALKGADIYQNICAQCHGTDGSGGVGPALNDPAFQANNSDQEIFDSISLGHTATSMIAWGDILSAGQIEQLVAFLRNLQPGETKPSITAPSFSLDVQPIIKDNCLVCHGSMGGWDASTYEKFMTSGDNSPVVIPGDAENSLLAKKLLGTHSEGMIMPPNGKLPDQEIQVILDWINAGALDN